MPELMKTRNGIGTKLDRMLLKLNNHGTAPLTKDIVLALQADLERSKEKFDKVHDELLDASTDAAAVAVHEAEAEKIEAKMLAVDALIAQILRSFPVVISTRNARTNFTGDVKLPNIDLPTFSGAYMDWTAFHDMFNSLVHSNNNISPSQKLHYLRNAVQGEAAGQLVSLETSDANYAKAWDMLKNRYENKRQIIYAHLDAVFDQQQLIAESALGLRKLLDTTTKHLNSLDSFGTKEEQRDQILVHLITKRLDSETRKQWELHSASKTFPNYADLAKFIEDRCIALEVSARQLESNTSNHNIQKSYNSNQPQKQKPFQTKQQKTGSYHSSMESILCANCKSNHFIYQCSDFLKLDAQERINLVRRLKLCYNCLRLNHSSAQCKSKFTCKQCKGKHNTLLHLEKKEKNQEAASNSRTSSNQNLSASSSSLSSSTTSHFCNQSEPKSEGLLNTALLKYVDDFGQEHECRALLDNGSQSSFITEDCVRRLGLKVLSASQTILGIGHSNSGKSVGSVQLSLKSINSNFAFQLSALIIKKITGLLPSKRITSINWNNMINIPLADPKFNQPAEIDMLLDVAVCNHLIVDGRFKVNDLIAQNTHLGWILSSTIGTQQEESNVYSHLTTIDVQDQLRKFWELEEVNHSQRLLSKEEQACEDYFQSTTTRDSSGRYVVALPIKESVSLGLSRDLAIKRLQYTERRLEKLSHHKSTYHQFMDEYLKLGHMELIQPSEVREDLTSTFYLPHHYVIKESSTTTTLRVVYDGSAKTTNGIALNEKLMVGPKLQDDIFNLLLRFRLHKHAFTADISKMFRQIRVRDEDTHLQRIVWRSSPSESIKDYRLTTVTYGTACGPYLATKALRQVAVDEGDNFPLAKVVVERDFYVDDVMSGANTIESALNLQKQLIEMLAKGGFLLRKWTSNSSELLESLPLEYRETQLPLQIDSHEAIKALGLHWHPGGDYFFFKVNLSTTCEKPTKRKILSDVAKLFDPLGWLSPIIIIGKTLFQKLWIRGLDWDEVVPLEIEEEWTQFRNQLNDIRQFRIPRYFGTGIELQLHGFCDASEKAYAGAVYVRIISSTGAQAYLICSKTKVAPVKIISIPKLELCGAVLLSRLVKTTISALKVNFSSICAWSDSKTVLDWISGLPYSWKTFVANRVTEIQDVISPEFWKHVPTKDNPADIASRGVLPQQLISNKLWWNGPSWLQHDESYWPEQLRNSESTTEELRTRSHVVQLSEEPEILRKFSSLSKLQRVIAWCFRFCHILCKRESKQGLVLSVIELRQSLEYLVRVAQQHYFGDFMENIKSKTSIKDHISALNPFIDSSGLLRVGGRLSHAKISYDKKYPILLPKQSTLTKLIIQHEHQIQLHAGPQLLLSCLQQKYWIINGRKLIRHQISKCLRCFRYRAQSLQQQMGDLPSYRLEATRPFLKTGVDYGGPFSTKVNKGRGGKIIKSYIALFVCCVTKAVHLELVSELSTECFLAALSRFTSRRGNCSVIYSDNGTNFVGARNELEEIQKLINSAKHNQVVYEKLSSNGTEWRFIPPKGPHFGGLWEAAIKSVKTHLKKVLGSTTPTFEEFTTILTRIEACLNSRPLTPISTDPNDLSVLTPGHFLIGTSLTATIEHDLTDLNTNRLSRFQLIQQTSQHFWKRWSTEYLCQLQQRSKWLESSDNVKVDSMVLIKEDNIPPLQWRMARVVKAYPGTDGLVRVVDVRTSSGIIKRPITKLCLLPMD